MSLPRAAVAGNLNSIYAPAMSTFELAQCYVKTDDSGNLSTLHVRHGVDWNVINLKDPNADLDVIRPLLERAKVAA